MDGTLHVFCNVHGQNIIYYLECTWTEHYILHEMYMDRTVNIIWNVHGRNITFFVESKWTEHQILFGMYRDGTLHDMECSVKQHYIIIWNV